MAKAKDLTEFEQELLAKERALTEILNPEGDETLAEAAARIVEGLKIEREENIALREQLAATQPVPKPAKEIQLNEIPDDDPTDRRPAFNPELGWRTPEVVAWGERRLAKLNAA